MKEIEVKILEVDEEKIRKILRNLGAKVVMKKNLQKNSIFSSKQSKGNGRIRLRRDIHGSTLSFKSLPKFVKAHKIVDEYETKIGSYEVVENGLKLMGFKEIGVIETIREDWKYGGCMVSIMTKPLIPTLIEIEGNKENILRVANKLGYTSKDFYPKIIYQKYGIKNKFLRFKKNEKN